MARGDREAPERLQVAQLRPRFKRCCGLGNSHVPGLLPQASQALCHVPVVGDPVEGQPSARQPHDVESAAHMLAIVPGGRGMMEQLITITCS